MSQALIDRFASGPLRAASAPSRHSLLSVTTMVFLAFVEIAESGTLPSLYFPTNHDGHDTTSFPQFPYGLVTDLLLNLDLRSGFLKLWYGHLTRCKPRLFR